jgi:hypothetical protein
LSEWDLQAINANFEGWRRERAPTITVDRAFERYAIEYVLRDSDLSDEEIEYGWVGGPDDGGIDGIFFFVNRLLMQEETEIPNPALSADLVIIQAKNAASFEENAVEKLHTFTRDLFDYAKVPNSFSYYSQTVKEAISNFREKYTNILSSPHIFNINFFYVTKSQGQPNPKVQARVDNLRALVTGTFSAAVFSFEFWGCVEFLAQVRTVRKTQMALDVLKYFTTEEKSVVCLVKLSNYAAFLSDEHGQLRKSILEPNVRDYQGKRNPVNSDIRGTLTNKEHREFWLFNNGVTILATDCSIAGDKLTVTSPEVVNGLQTSQEIFSYFKDNPEKKDSRSVLIRVIVPEDEKTRNKITKATNFQTPVEPLSLRATDQIHFDIEERYELFYDRRKGKYRNLRKPISKIVTIRALAQSIIAVVLRRPNDARGSPQKLLNQDGMYEKIFDTKVDRDLYVVCALLDKQTADHLDLRADVTPEEIRDIRYYVEMWLVAVALKKANPKSYEIASLRQLCVTGIPLDDMAAAVVTVLEEYKALGGTDTIAKGPQLRARLLERLATTYPSSDTQLQEQKADA